MPRELGHANCDDLSWYDVCWRARSEKPQWGDQKPCWLLFKDAGVVAEQGIPKAMLARKRKIHSFRCIPFEHKRWIPTATFLRPQVWIFPSSKWRSSQNVVCNVGIAAFAKCCARRKLCWTTSTNSTPRTFQAAESRSNSNGMSDMAWININKFPVLPWEKKKKKSLELD